MVNLSLKPITKTARRLAVGALAAVAIGLAPAVIPASSPVAAPSTAQATFKPCGKDNMRHVKTKTSGAVKMTVYARFLSNGTAEVCVTAYKVKEKSKNKELSLKGVKTSKTKKKTWVQRLDNVPTGVGLTFTAKHAGSKVSFTFWN